MSKVMSILEKCNLVEKVNKENLKDTNLNEESNIDSVEVIKNENNIFKVENNDYKEEIKAAEPLIKKKPLAMETNIEYDKKMMINEIYSLYGLENSNVNTIFMLQNLINALPQNLPQEVIKQSVMNIIAASDIDLNQLLSDGEQRLEALIKVIDKYNSQINKRVVEYKEEIAKLTNLINNCEEQIKIKENMLEEQSYLVKYETQKISGIIDFFRK